MNHSQLEANRENNANSVHSCCFSWKYS